MAEEAGKILHMLQKHFIIFKVINKSNPLLGWSTKPPTQQSQPESINYLPILRLLPSSGVQLFETETWASPSHSMTANCQQSASLSFTPYTFSLSPSPSTLQSRTSSSLPETFKHASIYPFIHSSSIN